VSQSNISPDALQDEQPDLSVIIVSWNVRDLLARCLDALRSDSVRGDLSLEIIVVDNASYDGSADSASGVPGVRVIQAGSNLGYGRANNMGFEAARGRHLLVLNPDTVPQPGSLPALFAFVESHPAAGIASPRLLNPGGSVQEAAFRFPTLAMAWLDLFPLPPVIPGRLRLKVLLSRLNGRYPVEQRASEPFPIDHPLGACMLINRAAYEQLGGFDPALHMYSEEIDLAMRYARAGWECWQVPAARVVHLGGQSTRQAPDRMYVELWRSRLYFYSRYRPLAARIALRAMLASAQLLDVTRTLWAVARGRIGRPEARRRWRRAGAVLRLIAGGRR
jgi:GT2 family glycosyltransferase